MTVNTVGKASAQAELMLTHVNKICDICKNKAKKYKLLVNQLVGKTVIVHMQCIFSSSRFQNDWGSPLRLVMLLIKYVFKRDWKK